MNLSHAVHQLSLVFYYHTSNWNVNSGRVKSISSWMSSEHPQPYNGTDVQYSADGLFPICRRWWVERNFKIKIKLMTYVSSYKYRIIRSLATGSDRYWASLVVQMVKNPLQCGRPEFDPWVEWLPTPIFSPEEFHGQRSLAGYSPCGRKESDMTERLSLSLSDMD